MRLMIERTKTITIVGGGAAGFFAAIHAAVEHPNALITILEGSNKVLAKVLISGGGRCNVTNTISTPSELVQFYPRGHKELRKPFEQFSSDHTQEWFEKRGVQLKTELDGRVFPTTDNSKTIANALTWEAEKLGIHTRFKCRAESFEKTDDGWRIMTNSESIDTDILVIASGGSPRIWESLEKLGLKTIPPVPSLFTFHCQSPLLEELAGISLPNARVSIPKSKIVQEGPILITHEGLSGPAILKLSAWAARELYDMEYRFSFKLNWLGLDSAEKLIQELRNEQENNPKKYVSKNPVLDIPKRFWARVCKLCDIPETRNYAEIGKKQINKLSEILLNFQVSVTGKSTNKEEFVTAGGVDLSEINFDDFSAKNHSKLYLAGEVLDIDAVTGGFNFQAAWTAGYLVGKGIKM